jgi:tRNA-dihydrouridine synthase B
MIGRASFGNPWVFADAANALSGATDYRRPALDKRIDVAIHQFELALADKGEHITCLEARKHFAWYLRGVAHSSFYKNQISSLSTMEDIYRVAKEVVRDLK